MGATEFSSYAALEMRYISEFHEILGNSSGARYWAQRANQTISAIHELMWDEEDAFYYYTPALAASLRCRPLVGSPR
jgi:neutral trehalase